MKVPGLSQRGVFLTLGLAFLGVVLLNAVAWRHAWRFTQFVEDGSRTEGSKAELLDEAAASLVLENPFDRLVTTVGHRFESMGLPTFPGAQRLVFWGGVQVGFNGFRQNPVEYAQTVRVPTLLLIGEQDPRVHVDEVESIASALLGPKQVVVFPGAAMLDCSTPTAPCGKSP